MNGLDQPIVLAGDIGGTKTNLGLFARGENRPTMLVMESYSSAHAAGLSELITRFLEAHPQSVSCGVLWDCRSCHRWPVQGHEPSLGGIRG